MIEQKSSASQFTKPAITPLLLAVIGILLLLSGRFREIATTDPLLLDSTVGELAVWMSDQTGEDEIESFLGNYAENWAQSLGEEALAPEIILQSMQNSLVTGLYLLIVIAAIGLILLYLRPRYSRSVLLVLLIGIDIFLFIIPVIEGDNSLTLILVAIFLMIVVLLLTSGKVSRVLGFFVVLSFLFVVWESSKALASMVDYKILLPQSAWEYDSYPTLEEALGALDNAEIDAVIYDRRDLSDLMPIYPEDPEIDVDSLAFPNLRYLNDLDAREGFAIFPITPEFPGRLKVAVRADTVDSWQSISDFYGESVATVTGEFAEERYLGAERNLVLVDLKILNDINLPHLQTIAEAFLQPARRNGSQLLIRILANAGWFTWGEAALGFGIGAILGLILGSVFAHSYLMERSLLPYVVASQTVPILAIAPMVVIWLGASQLSVAVIAAYLTFFPVTINTLRGLRAPSQSQVDLMQSYAANRWTILWKLRFPAALPYIFTALKVSATASVVGAIIGGITIGYRRRIRTRYIRLLARITV